jgi:ferredoxin
METALKHLPHADLDRLIEAVRDAGYACLGPQVESGAIVYGPIERAAQLPRGRHDQQSGGEYRLTRSDSPRSFAWANGPQALKPICFRPRESLWRAGRNAEGRIEFTRVDPTAVPTAVLGVRACDLAALALQDKHFLDGPYADPYYAAQREQLLLIAVHCTHPAATCFCASTGDGPHAESGFDIGAYETDEGLLLHAGSERGRAIIDALELSEAPNATALAAQTQVQAAAEGQSRSMPGENLRDTLFARLEHPQWEDVGERCLACANCTSVCPTCFCHREAEDPALHGEESLHYREWGSCFSAKHSYIGGWVPRSDTRLRYRQWLTHKLGSWHDQYGRSGCVGCGRCITWCPVGIDITAEARAICEGEAP